MIGLGKYKGHPGVASERGWHQLVQSDVGYPQGKTYSIIIQFIPVGNFQR